MEQQRGAMLQEGGAEERARLAAHVKALQVCFVTVVGPPVDAPPGWLLLTCLPDGPFLTDLTDPMCSHLCVPCITHRTRRTTTGRGPRARRGAAAGAGGGRPAPHARGVRCPDRLKHPVATDHLFAIPTVKLKLDYRIRSCALPPKSQRSWYGNRTSTSQPSPGQAASTSVIAT